MNHARGFVQTRVAKEVKLRFAPIIKFLLDESIEKSIRVSKILDDLARERGEDPEERIEAGTTSEALIEDDEDEGEDDSEIEESGD